jgi:hypothetical protein
MQIQFVFDNLAIDINRNSLIQNLQEGRNVKEKVFRVWLSDKNAIDACLKRFQTAADQRFGPKSLFYFPVVSTDVTGEETSRRIR